MGYTTKEMAQRKAVFTETLSDLSVAGYVLVGRTKEGMVYEDGEGHMVVVTAVAKKESYDFAEAEAEFLDSLEAQAERKAKAEAKKAKAEGKKTKAATPALEQPEPAVHEFDASDEHTEL